MRSGDVSPTALAISIALHGSIVLFTSTALPVGNVPKPSRNHPADAWAGDTFDVEVVGANRAVTRNPPTVVAARLHASAGASIAQSPRRLPRPAAARPTHTGRRPRPDAPPPVTTASAQAVAPEPEHSSGKTSLAPISSQSPAASTADGTGASRDVAFGAAGLPSDTRNLTRAFTRALPAAAMPAGAEWLGLPWGPGATACVSFTLGNDGKIVDFSVAEPGPPPYLDALLRRAELLLKRGQFALRGDRQVAGRETYRVAVRLERRSATDDPFADPGHIMRRGFIAPTAEHPGHAYFTFASGRHVDLTVSVEADPLATDSRPQ